jgi:hypothetical protein
MHPAFVQNMTYNTLTFQELAEMPFGLLASHLRSKIDPETSTLAHDTRALATFLSCTADKSCVSFAATIKGASDIFFSSWAKMRCYEYDFGVELGKAEVVRRTRSRNLTEGLMYLMPRSPSGEIGLVICLSEEDIAALRNDKEFAEFAEYVGRGDDLNKHSCSWEIFSYPKVTVQLEVLQTKQQRSRLPNMPNYRQPNHPINHSSCQQTQPSSAQTHSPQQRPPSR